MKPIAGGWACAAALCAVLAGCESLQPRSVQIDAAAGRFRSAQLTYEVDTGRLSQPVQTARISGQQISYQQQPSSPQPDHSSVRLSVQYPHPRGKADFALAEVIVEGGAPPAKTSSGVDKSSWQRFTGAFADAMNDILPGMRYGQGVREAWALDIPKADVDQLIGDLANSGYFAYAPETQPGVEVFASLDGKIIRKTWRPVPALDAFIERVRHEGQLVSYTRPAGSEGQPADLAGGRNDSVAAYQRQLQREARQPQLPPSQPFPANINAMGQRPGQPAPYAGTAPVSNLSGVQHQDPRYAAPPASNAVQGPSLGLANGAGLPPEFRSAGTPSYGSAPPNGNMLPAPSATGSSHYGAPATPQTAPAGPYGPAVARPYPAAGPAAPPTSYRQPIGAGQPYPASPPVYPQSGAPPQQNGYPQPSAQAVPATNVRYSRGY